jgi:hypothetical protein
MSRPHGCDVVATTRIRNIKNAPSFQDARKALVSTLENVSFLKVVTVQAAPNGVYTGEAVEIHFRDSRERPKLVFFDKFGRSRNLLRIGPISLAQAPLGFDHPTSVPTVGEILVGSLVPNTRKSHLEHVLRGWSSEAKPLYELLRILKFGTKNSEFECRSILLQPSSSLLQSPDHLKAARDDIYMTARIILWGSIRSLQVLASIQDPDRITLLEAATEIEITQARGIRISSKAIDYFDSLTMKLADTNLSDAFLSGIRVAEQRPAEPRYMEQRLADSSQAAYDPSKMFVQRPRTPTLQESAQTYAFGKASGSAFGPAFGPAFGQPSASQIAPHPILQPSSGNESPYAPASPMVYAPSSPIDDHTFAPSSPPEHTFAPSSPRVSSSSQSTKPSPPFVIREQPMVSDLANLYNDL